MGEATAMDVVLRTPWGGPWRGFHEPEAVFSAWRAEDVASCLEDVARGVRGGGYAAGFLAYEAAAAFGLPARPAAPDGLPLVQFGLYPPDRVASQGRPRAHGACVFGPWTPSIDHAAYLAAVARIKQEIAEGNTYQINFTFRLRAPWEGDPLAAAAALDTAQRGAWGAVVDTGRHVICSASPELFFTLRDGVLECRPMKGTAARGLWPADDLARADALRRSPKDRAENVMIVDMVRNDIGRVARTGSVAVASLFDVERYPRQWQMTSTVRGVAGAAGLPELMAALFPSGSVTGAPKHSSMRLIRDLECSPRGVYTGAIGYLSPRRRAHFSVAIRTVVLDRATSVAEFGTGSGIVWDSVDQDEYRECLLKASILAAPGPPFRLLETIGFDPEMGLRLIDRHLARLRASADYFGYPLDEAEALAALDRAVADVPGAARLRLLLAQDGSLVCQATDLSPTRRPLRAALAPEPVDPADAFLYHKTTRRGVYERARGARPDADTVILWNANGEVTEGTEANVVAEIDGRRVTPPVACGLLGGTLRAELLARGEIAEARVTVDALRRARRFWLINAVRGWMDAELIA